MAASALAQHLPSLFGPSRRAAWRLSVARRALAALAILLALHLTLGAVRPPETAAPRSPAPSGPRLSLPLALPADHLSPGDRVGVYLPGRATPVATGARVVSTSESPSGQIVAEVTMRTADVGPILRDLGPEGAAQGGFVLVRTADRGATHP